MKIERRFTKGAEVRATETAAHTPQIEGYAAVFNADYVMYEDSTFRIVERIKPGAFTPVLDADVRCLFNHDRDNVLGRTTNGTLSIAQDDKGLSYKNEMNNETRIGKDVHQFVQRKDVTGCSFAFTVGKDSVTREKTADGRYLLTRTIEEIDGLYDVGPVTYPAYEQTSVSAREERSAADELPASVRAAMAEPEAAAEPFDSTGVRRYNELLDQV